MISSYSSHYVISMAGKMREEKWEETELEGSDGCDYEAVTKCLSTDC